MRNQPGSRFEPIKDGAPEIPKGMPLPRELSRPGLRVPGFLGLSEQLDEFFAVGPLDVIAPVIEDVDHRIVVEAQDGPGVEGKPMLQGDSDAGRGKNRFSLGDRHMRLKDYNLAAPEVKGELAVWSRKLTIIIREIC